jgi:hypothetical protein
MHYVLTRSQVAALRDIRGGDEARLALFTGPELGVKMLGRQHVDSRLLGVLKAVVTTRGVDLNGGVGQQPGE